MRQPLKCYDTPSQPNSILSKSTPKEKLTLQPRHPLIPQPILWQHPPHRPPQHLRAPPLRKQLIHRHLLQAPRPRRVRVVFLLEAFFAGGVEVVAAERDDVVAAVGGGVEDGLVLAHEGYGNLGGYAAEGAGVGADVDGVPGAAVGEACLESFSGWVGGWWRGGD